jgi:hypothetical protein
MGANLLRIIALLQCSRPQTTDMSGLEPHNNELGIKRGMGCTPFHVF